MSDSKSRNGLADLPANLQASIEKQVDISKMSGTSRDHRTVASKLTDQELSKVLALIEKQAKRSKTSYKSRDHGPEEIEHTGQNRLKSETETPSYYSYFNSETSSSVEFDSCSSSSDNSYTNYDLRDAMIWVTFYCLPCKTEANLLDWLEHNKPSKINVKGMLQSKQKIFFKENIFKEFLKSKSYNTKILLDKSYI